jgi:photosystem II stability/assembly factor-like uncharacterized protein
VTVLLRRRIQMRLALWGLLAAGFLSLAALPGRSDDQPKSTPREKQIADLEQQLKSLQKKLSELRQVNYTTETPSHAKEGALPTDWVKALSWRCIGPANMAGRITAISVFEADPSTYWIATASGGLLKTTNNGITFEHQFDREATVSVGDVCVAPSDRNVVWVGTGEGNPRNSVSWGDGVYKSTDGGKSWKNMGLKQSFQIGRVVVHPKDPNTVYVGALGRLYGPNPERGLFKTTDGGQTWQKLSLPTDEKTGVLDLRMHPTEPNTLIAATWERQRDQFDAFFGGTEGDQYGPVKTHAPGTALYKTTDGGQTWKKLTKGLPAGPMGRIGLDWYRKDPNIIYAIIDTEKAGQGPPRINLLRASADKAEGGLQIKGVNPDGPAGKAGLKAGDVIKTVNGKAAESAQAVNTLLQNARPGQKLTFSVARGEETKDVAVALEDRTRGRGGPGGGGGFGGGGRGGFAGVAALGAMGEDAEGGARVTRIFPEGAADKAGIHEGDLIQTVTKKKVEGFQQLLEQLQEHKEGDKVPLRIRRGTETRDVELTVGSAASFAGRGPSARRPYGSGLGGQEENVQYEQGPDGYQTGGLFKSTDAGESWVRINSINPRPMYFSQVRVDPTDDKFLYVLGVSQYSSRDGGTTFTGTFGRGVHADGHTLWVDPTNGRHMLIGCDGGFYQTYDRGINWDHLNTSAIGQFYHVAVDSRPLYRVYGGLQDNGTWGGPSRTRNATGPINEDWISVGGGDGFRCAVDPNDPDLVYYESQNGAFGRRNLRTGETGSIRPRPPGGGGGARTGGEQGEKPAGRAGGQRGAGGGGPRYRFNWNTPFILSSHNSKIFYCAGNFVFRSLDRGNDLRIISPEITASSKGSATALAESPRNPNVLWVGSDDGALWVTRDGGVNWTNVAKNVGLPGPRWVASLEASRFAEGRCYAAFDAHRSDDDEPYVYVTEDFGQTWKSLRGNLPTGSSRVLREDLKNANLLYAGTEFAAWASLDRGQSWTKINNNLPTVAVHDFAQHPTTGEMAAATHGRSLWIVDVTPLRQMTEEVLKAKAHLYQPNTAVRWRQEPRHGGTSRRFVGQNPPPGAQIYFSLTGKADKVSLKVVDYTGKTVRELFASAAPGLHRVSWDMTIGTGRPGAGEGAVAGRGGFGGRGGQAGGGQRGQRGGQPGTAQRGTRAGQPTPPTPGESEATAQPQQPQQEGETPTEPGPFPGGGFGFGFGRLAAPGMYRVVLTVDGQEFTQPLRVEADPDAPTSLLASEEDDDDVDK